MPDWSAFSLPGNRNCSLGRVVAIVAGGLFLSLLGTGPASSRAAATEEYSTSYGASRPSLPFEGAATPASAGTQLIAARGPKRANFLRETASRDTRRLADWVTDSGDNRSLPFVIVDKTAAKVFVFDSAGRLRGAALALVGLAPGDDSVPGIGDMSLSSIRPELRTTPAGRFVAELGYDLTTDILWVDYATAISLHRVINTNPRERRLQRLASRAPLEHRISYGCINVPAKFYETIVRPAFTGTNGIVYILPETRTIEKEFPADRKSVV